MSASKDVVEFMAVFSKLREALDDNPRNLREDAIRDQDIRLLCEKLDTISSFILNSERRHPELFSAPVDPSFIKYWRDFERWYQNAVSQVALAMFWDSLSPEGDFEDSLSEVEAWGSQQVDDWRRADASAGHMVADVETALEFAEFNANQDWRFGDETEEHVQDVKAGLKYWDEMFVGAGFDSRVFFVAESWFHL